MEFDKQYPNYLTTALDKQNFDFTEKHFTYEVKEEDWKRGVKL
jgi:hypothetical protein